MLGKMLAWSPCVPLQQSFAGLASGLASAAPMSLLRMQRVPVLPTGDLSFVCNEAFENCKAVLKSSLLDSVDSEMTAMCPWRETQFIELIDASIDASKQQSYQEAMVLLLTCWGLLAVQLIWMSFSKK